jgi:hypothetical protein
MFFQFCFGCYSSHKYKNKKGIANKYTILWRVWCSKFFSRWGGSIARGYFQRASSRHPARPAPLAILLAGEAGHWQPSPPSPIESSAPCRFCISPSWPIEVDDTPLHWEDDQQNHTLDSVCESSVDIPFATYRTRHTVLSRVYHTQHRRAPRCSEAPQSRQAPCCSW